MKRIIVGFSLLALVNSAEVDFKCTLKHCMSNFLLCTTNRQGPYYQMLGESYWTSIFSDCKTALGCLAKCDEQAKPSCAYDCGYFNPELPLGKFIDCNAKFNCSSTTTIGRWWEIGITYILCETSVKDGYVPFLFVCQVHRNQGECRSISNLAYAIERCLVERQR